jgi:hypothetical protein
MRFLIDLGFIKALKKVAQSQRRLRSFSWKHFGERGSYAQVHFQF